MIATNQEILQRKASLVQVRSVDFNVHEVPAPGLGIFVPVCPCGFTGDFVSSQSIGVGCKQGINLFANIRLQERFRDQRYDFVPFIAPC
jgi:hypothetical protein